MSLDWARSDPVTSETSSVTVVSGVTLRGMSVGRTSFEVWKPSALTSSRRHSTRDTALDAVTALPLDALTPAAMLTVLARLETIAWRHPVAGQRPIARLDADVPPRELGAKNMAAALADCLRISRTEARGRIADAHDLEPRRALTGEPLPPKLSATAAAQARPKHVRIIRRFFDDLPDAIDVQTREQPEATLARSPPRTPPTVCARSPTYWLALLHPDGEFSEVDRARRRFLTLGKQQADGMTPITGLLDPQGRATWEAFLAVWAAPGMCNPDDKKPCTDDTPDEAAVRGDQRSEGQRNHDALTAGVQI